ncbi:MAG: hypothetical protein A2600_06465 [Candidatus Lambdaproteobacteria bacterium RIFOXYD1_FULL_56_27]|uniref:Thiol:disulfide interchange protein DsbD N-terminal domain-containing protein n=1 Tax=Candidatus Lambdaproteobacteria bacterium RIFOXYD2_FULL_56_26 TaxID=1817773 RepID=A0A1F6H0N6_9PROT|nr:MAG: hypothetical protein A2426_05880 [Candidatus Lambdaproteobacteria bacterium RIFOXYC1_FULL_56_13]OGH03850.1 MAG: hypothetical protein A2557_11975 [Candidatus Lambdaproteobacteria bacterium RIFOXYD2_FULL_56_26]OGH08978.1 MAG: hypothetical protein A2600_06465 [Candidatus Lambdaproteobacteria bacterium RIFOXYD1_FULL_56_27]
MQFFFLLFFFLGYPLSGGAGQGAFLNPTPYNSAPEIVALAQATPTPQGFKLTLTVRLEPKFHLYSVKPQGKFGPKPTALVVQTSGLEPVGALGESPPLLKVDSALGLSLWVHEKEFWVAQEFKNPGKLKGPIRGYLFYQLCDNLVCLNPAQSSFELKIP